MTQHELELFLKETNINGVITSFEKEEDCDWTKVHILVPREDYDKCFQVENENHDKLSDFSITWEQKSPVLVPAKIGDLVIIFSKYESSDDKSNIGIVTSIFNKGNEVTYGCSHIQLAIGDRWVNQLYDFALTEEDYGGYPTGFIKIITKEELIDQLKIRAQNAYLKELEIVKSQLQRTQERIPEFVDVLSNYKIIKTEKISIKIYPLSIIMPKTLEDHEE